MKQQELAGIPPASTMAKSKRKTYVGAPSTCQICNRPFGQHMFDARTDSGRWANLCRKCFENYGCGLGTGCGQHYILEADGWIKVAG